MTGRTLPGIVIGGFFIVVAGLAIRRSHRLVVEGGLCPIGGVMAARTLPAIVIGRFICQVAEFAICRVSQAVIKVHLLPR